MRKTLRILSGLMALSSLIVLMAFVTNQSASVVIGHQNFTSGSPNDTPAGGNTADSPVAVNFDGTHFFVCDNSNNRILVYNGIPTSNNAAANYVIGQPDLVSSLPNQGSSTPSANSLDSPNDVFSNGTTLFVADTGNNRILVYSPVPTSSNAPAQFVIGQSGFTTNTAAISSTGLDTPEGVCAAGSTLFVADTNNWRVLLYNTNPVSDGQAAAVVIGAKNFTSKSAGNGSVTQMYNPQGVCVAGTTLAVADSGNSRVLLYAPIPTASNPSASFVIGQTGFGIAVTNTNGGGSAGVTTLDNPAGVTSDGTRLFIADTGNNRTLIYNSCPVSNNAPADQVVGQPDFASALANQGGIPSASTEDGPTQAYSNGATLAIADVLNNRVLIFDNMPASPNATANSELGQPDFLNTAPNQASVGDFLYNPEAVMVDSQGRLILADFTNNRVLVYNSVPVTNYTAADVVVGQPDFSTTDAGTSASGLYTPYGAYSNGTQLYVSDTSNNRVLVYPPFPISNGVAAVTVLGQADFVSGLHNQGNGSTCSASSLWYPRDLWVNSTGSTILVADSSNNRVLVFANISSQFNAPALAAVGETSLTDNTTGSSSTSSKTLFGPWGVYCDGTRMIVGDSQDNRVMIYNSIPVTSNAAANVELGQTSFSGFTANQGGAPTSQTLDFPAGVFSDGTNLYVADEANNRLLIYNNVGGLSNGAGATVVLGQASMSVSQTNDGAGSVNAQGFDAPNGVFVSSGNLFATDLNNSRGLIFYPPTPTFTATPTSTPTACGPGTSLNFSWSTQSAMPTAIYNFGTATVNGIIYCIGGNTTSSTYLNTVYSYNPSSNTWATLAPMPTARDFLGVGVVNGIIYAVGGANSSSSYLGTVEAYNPGSNTWATKASLPVTMGAMGVAGMGTTLYCMGGSNGTLFYNTTYAYDTVGNTWTTVAPMPTGRDQLSACAVNGVIYALGGQTSSSPVTYVGTVEGYNPSNNTWTTEAPMPANLVGTASAALNGILYVAGGSPTLVITTNSVEAYNPTGNSWATVNPMITSRQFLGLGAANGNLYAVGGCNGTYTADANNEEAIPFCATNTPTATGTLPTATSTPTNTATYTASTTPTKTTTNTATNTPTNTPTNTTTNTATNTATNTTTNTPTNTPTNTATNTQTNTTTHTPTQTTTNTATNTTTNTSTQTATDSSTNTTTHTPTQTATNTTTNTPTNTTTNTPTQTATNTTTPTTTNTPTNTATNTCTSTMTNTPTNTPTSTTTNTPTNTATNSPTNTPSNTATNTTTNTATSTTTNTPTVTATFTATNTPTNTFANTATNTATSTTTNTPTQTTTNTTTNTATNTPTLTTTATPTQTTTNSPTNTATLTTTNTPTKTPTNTTTNTCTNTPTNTTTNTTTSTTTNTPTNTFANTATKTATNTATLTATNTPINTTTATASYTPTATPTNTTTSSATATPTPTPSLTPSFTPSSTPTASVSATPTFTPTLTATASPSVTVTNTTTSSPSLTPSNTPVATSTPTQTQTFTPTVTPSNSPTPTYTLSPTFSPTLTYTPTITFTPTITSTPTPTGSVTSTPTPNAALYLDENFFNPNNQPLGMDVRVDTAGEVKIVIFNIAGEEVEKLVDQQMNPGNYRFSWDGRNRNGDITGNAVYFVVVEQPSGNTLKKVIVLK